jgi:hypothetical protein
VAAVGEPHAVPFTEHGPVVAAAVAVAVLEGVEPRDVRVIDRVAVGEHAGPRTVEDAVEPIGEHA